MTFRFVHTADWHIGKTFGAFDSDKAAVLRDARMRAVETIANVARDDGGELVLVAGDIFDGHGLGDDVLRRLMSLLRSAHDVTWHLLPGNHDEDRPRGVWERISAWGLPDNVILHREPGVVELNDEAVLLPAPLAAKQSSLDPTAWFDNAALPGHAIVVGLAHGSTHGFGGESSVANEIAPARVKSAKLDYLALGDWHGTKNIADRVWYSGTPETSGFVDNDSGNALVVAIDGPSADPRVEPVQTGQYGWHRLEVAVDVAMSADDALQRLLVIDRNRARQVVRFYLKGQMELEPRVDLEQMLVNAAPEFFDLDVRWDDLHVASAGHAGELFTSPELAGLADGLAGEAGITADEAVRSRALELLGAFALKARETAA